MRFFIDLKLGAIQQMAPGQALQHLQHWRDGFRLRGQQVLRLVADGCDNAAIAKRLRRSRRTVENRLSAVLDKLQARNRQALLLRA